MLAFKLPQKLRPRNRLRWRAKLLRIFNRFLSLKDFSEIYRKRKYSTLYRQIAYSGIFLSYSGIRHPQRGIIGISLLAVIFWNNYFIPEKT